MNYELNNNQQAPILIKDKDGQFKFVTAEGEMMFDDYLAKYAGEAAKPKTVPRTASSAAELQKIVQAVIAQSGANVPEELKKRLENILVSFLKEVRGEVATRVILTQGAAEGGVGLAGEMADGVIKLLKAKLSASSFQLPASSFPLGLAARPSSLRPRGLRQLPATPNALDWTHELMPPPPAVREDRIQKIEVRTPRLPSATLGTGGSGQGWKMEPFGSAQGRERKIAQPIAAVSELPEKKREEAAVELPQRQVKIEGIKFQPHLMGPIDELKNLDLMEFRRLAKEPAAAARKIKEKIDLLAEDSFAQKFKGIKAWRESRLNKLYLAIGEAGLREKKPVARIISEREKRGEEALNEKEFEAVIELNRWLRAF